MATEKMPTAFILFILSIQVLSADTSVICRLQGFNTEGCTVQCPDGRRMERGCEMCDCKSSLCTGVDCRIGYRCEVQLVGQSVWSMRHKAQCVIDENYIPPQDPVDNRILAPCQQWGTCTDQSDCPQSYVCRSDGRCCFSQNSAVLSTVQPMKINKCMEKPEVGDCRALGTQYVYDKDIGRCKQMASGGCPFSKNSFFTMKICEDQCEKPCSRPTTDGCDDGIPRYFFNRTDKKCYKHDDKGCLSDGSNNLSAEDCEKHCSTLKNEFSTPTLFDFLERLSSFVTSRSLDFFRRPRNQDRTRLLPIFGRVPFPRGGN